MVNLRQQIRLVIQILKRFYKKIEILVFITKFYHKLKKELQMFLKLQAKD